MKFAKVFSLESFPLYGICFNGTMKVINNNVPKLHSGCQAIAQPLILLLLLSGWRDKGKGAGSSQSWDKTRCSPTEEREGLERAATRSKGKQRTLFVV